MRAEPTAIVLATDGTAASADARAAAAHLALAGKADLHVVHVWTPFAKPRGAAARVDEALVKAIAASEAEVLATRLQCPVVGVHTPRGYRAASILRVAARVGAGLVVVGGRKLGILEELFTYRVSEGVMQAAHRPVLFVPEGGSPWPPRNVVIGCDGSHEATRAAQLAGWIARLADAAVLVVRVVAPDSGPEVLRAAEQSVQECAEAAGSHARTRRMSTQVVTAADVPGALRQACAEVDQAPVLAIGARGSGALPRAEHLSVSRAISHHARLPLLLAPSPVPEPLT